MADSEVGAHLLASFMARAAEQELARLRVLTLRCIVRSRRRRELTRGVKLLERNARDWQTLDAACASSARAGSSPAARSAPPSNSVLLGMLAVHRWVVDVRAQRLARHRATSRAFNEWHKLALKLFRGRRRLRRLMKKREQHDLASAWNRLAVCTILQQPRGATQASSELGRAAALRTQYIADGVVLLDQRSRSSPLFSPPPRQAERGAESKSVWAAWPSRIAQLPPPRLSDLSRPEQLSPQWSRWAPPSAAPRVAARSREYETGSEAPRVPSPPPRSSALLAPARISGNVRDVLQQYVRSPPPSPLAVHTPRNTTRTAQHPRVHVNRRGSIDIKFVRSTPLPRRPAELTPQRGAGTPQLKHQPLAYASPLPRRPASLPPQQQVIRQRMQ